MIGADVGNRGLKTAIATGVAVLIGGGAVLAVYNRAYDPVGRDPGTGTTHPDVVRELARQGRR